jgi:hypothetical protein
MIDRRRFFAATLAAPAGAGVVLSRSGSPPPDCSDVAIVSLFREWIAAVIEAEALAQNNPADDTPEQAAFETACCRADDLVGAIADIPSQGPVGLAVKAFLRYRNENPPAWGEPPETLGTTLLDPGNLDSDLGCSIIADAVRFLPELGPLAAAVIGPSADKLTA